MDLKTLTNFYDEYKKSSMPSRLAFPPTQIESFNLDNCRFFSDLLEATDDENCVKLACFFMHQYFVALPSVDGPRADINGVKLSPKIENFYDVAYNLFIFNRFSIPFEEWKDLFLMVKAFLLKYLKSTELEYKNIPDYNMLTEKLSTRQRMFEKDPRFEKEFEDLNFAYR